MLGEPSSEKRSLWGRAVSVAMSPRGRGGAGVCTRLVALACAGLMVAGPQVVIAAPAAGEAAAEGSTAAEEPAAAKAAASEPAASKPAAAPASAASRQTEAYGERLDALDAEIGVLKDRIFRSKARLAVLRETVLAGAMAGARVMLAHRNLMGTGFQLSKVTYFLDGAPIFDRRDDSGALDQQDEIVVFDGNLAPGRHIVGVELIYKGKGVGSFSYLRGYTFQATSTYEIEVGERGSMKIVSVGYERGNITTEMGDRPSVDWQRVNLDAGGRPSKSSKSSKASKSSKGAASPTKGSGKASAKAGSPSAKAPKKG